MKKTFILALLIVVLSGRYDTSEGFKSEPFAAVGRLVALKILANFFVRMVAPHFCLASAHSCYAVPASPAPYFLSDLYGVHYYFVFIHGVVSLCQLGQFKLKHGIYY